MVVQNRSDKYQSVLWISIELALSVFYFLLMFFFFPFRDAFWMDFDEGINLVKSQMLLRGYSLYGEIWSDQPPLFTYLLSVALRTFGMEAVVGRVLVLLISCGLIFAFLHCLRVVWGNYYGLAGFMLLLLLPRFTELSVSTMVGLPAIAFAFFSMLALIYWHKRRTSYWLVISAIALAFSVLIKLFTAFLAPIFLAGILAGAFSEYRCTRNFNKLLHPAVIWGLCFSIPVILLLALMVTPDHFDQLFQNHLEAYGFAVYKSDPDYQLNTQLVDATPIIILALLGIFLSIRSKRWLALYPASWMVFAYIALRQHVPVWSHQQMLITVPAALLAAASVGDAIGGFVRIFRQRSLLAVNNIIYLISLILLFYVLAVRGPGTLDAFRSSPILVTARYKPTTSEAKIMRSILLYAPQTQWMITDIPMFAFYANIPIPPNLIVLSSKRLATGNLTEEQVLEEIRALKPEQVLFGRNEFPLIRAYLDTHYQIAYSSYATQYISKDITLIETTP